MRRVDKVCILAVYLQNIENHLPYQHGDREYLAEDGVAAQLFGCRYVERQTDEEEQQPPLDAPVQRQYGDKQCQHKGEYNQHRTWYQCLLEGLVKIVDVAIHQCFGNVGQQGEQTLYLGSHPAQTLLLEVVFVGYLLVIYMDVWLVVDMYLLAQQESLQLTVLTSSGQFVDILLEPLETEAHT